MRRAARAAPSAVLSAALSAVLSAALFAVAAAGTALADRERTPLLELSLGATGRLDELVLPGPELAVAPLTREAPLVVRRLAVAHPQIRFSLSGEHLTDFTWPAEEEGDGNGNGLTRRLGRVVVRRLAVRPHGTAHRYDFEVYGREDGTFDLTDVLVLADGGAPADDVPPVWVRVVDPLPAGQVEPTPLEATALPRLGGYRLLLGLGATAWVAGLAALLLVGRQRRRVSTEGAPARPVTLAERLRPLVEQAVRGELDPRQQARLERLLVATWRQQLGLEGLPPAEALRRLREDQQAGALLRALEAWLHHPPGRAAPPDLDALLAPYRDQPAEGEQP